MKSRPRPRSVWLGTDPLFSGQFYRITTCREYFHYCNLIEHPKSSPSVCELPMNVPLLFRQFSTGSQATVRKYRCLGHAVDRSVHGVENCFSCSLLLHHDYRPVCEFRNNSTKVPSREDVAPSFEDTEHKETSMPSSCR